MSSISPKSYSSITPRRVAFIGLGVMGYPMAGHLACAGHQVTVYNRTASKAQSWAQEFQGHTAATPKAAAENADVVFICVGNDDDLRAVTTSSDGVFAGLKTGGIVVDHTTASAIIANELANHAHSAGMHFIDAPVSGGQAGAVNGMLTIMCGGPKDTFQQVQDLMTAYGRAVTLIGATGSGQLAKMVNQICIAGVVQGLAEAIAFGQASKLDMTTVLEVISKGAAQSWQMENRGATMLKDEYEFGFAVDWMRKDLGLVLDEAKQNGARLPLTALVDQFYGDVQAMGGSRWDTSSLLKRLQVKGK